MRLKDDSVDIYGIHRDIIRAWPLIDVLWQQELGYELVLTSVNDGSHDKSSRHFINCAFDMRTHRSSSDWLQLDGDRREEILKKLRELLWNIDTSAYGPEYLVIDEPEKHHFHVQLMRASR